MRPTDLSPSPRTVTYAAIAAATAIKTSIATVVGGVTYSGVQLNGAIGAGAIAFPQTITVTSASHGGSYIITSPIVVTGTCLDKFGNSSVQSENLTLTLTGGGETIGGLLGFASVTSIVIPAMTDTGGAFTFGVGDIVMPWACRQLRGGSAGNIVVVYDGAFTDTIPCLTGERHDVMARKITSTGTTALPLTVYL